MKSWDKANDWNPVELKSRRRYLNTTKKLSTNGLRSFFDLGPELLTTWVERSLLESLEYVRDR